MMLNGMAEWGERETFVKLMAVKKVELVSWKFSANIELFLKLFAETH